MSVPQTNPRQNLSKLLRDSPSGPAVGDSGVTGSSGGALSGAPLSRGEQPKGARAKLRHTRAVDSKRLAPLTWILRCLSYRAFFLNHRQVDLINTFRNLEVLLSLPVCGFGIWPRKRAAFCACIMTNFDKSLSQFSRNSCWFEPRPCYLDFDSARLCWRSDNCQDVACFENTSPLPA